jgi:hypothetical protein
VAVLEQESRQPTAWSALARPVLRGGLHVVRRDDAHLQIGLDPPDRLVLPDRPGLLEALTQPGRRPPADLWPVLDELVRDGWVVDAAVDQAGTREHAPHVVLSVDHVLEAAIARACTGAGLVPGATGSLHVVATFGEPRRAVSDVLMRDDVPHLWLAVFPASVRIGPYVEPGRSACLRCLDAHLGERDPRRATVLHQHEQLGAPPHAEPDPCLLQLGAAWTARDVVRMVGGRPSALRSTTVTVTDDLTVTRRDWLRHPHCGCAWG